MILLPESGIQAQTTETRPKRTLYHANPMMVHLLQLSMYHITETMYIKQRLQKIEGEIDRNPLVVEYFNTSVKIGHVDRKLRL